jgi:hypothetical protein
MYVDLEQSYDLAKQIAGSAGLAQLPMDRPIKPWLAITFHIVLSGVTLLAILAKAWIGPRKPAMVQRPG